MSKLPTPHELLEFIQEEAFEGVDLTPLLTMDDEQLRTFTLEQMESLRGIYPDAQAALWLSDQFLTADRELIMIRDPHPWLALATEMKPREELSDLSDDEYRIAEWIYQMALFSHTLYTHEPFDPQKLGDGLKQGEEFADSFRYTNKAMIDWIRTAPYRRVAAMVCAIVMDLETDWAIQNNQAVQDYYAMEGWRNGYDWDKVDDCERYIDKCLNAMNEIEELYEKGHQVGLNDEEIRVLDALYGFAPHGFAEEDFPLVRDICEVAEKHLPSRPYIKSEQGQRKYGQAVFDDLKKVFAKHEFPFDPSDLTDLTPAYLDKWVYDKYYNE